MAECTTCQPATGFEIAAPLPGTPIGRFVVPLVRVNAKIDELKPGMVIPAQYLDIAGIAAAIAALPPATP